MQHIVRSNSFFWDEPLQDLNEDTVVDNGGFIIASKDHGIFTNPDTTWVPYVITNGEIENSGIAVNGRVYWARSMCDCVETWVDLEVIRYDDGTVFSHLLWMLFEGGYAWDLNYHFPTLYLPLVSIEGLQSANIMSFVTQFPSDPYIEEIVGTSESVLTADLTTESSLIDILAVFPWERFNEGDGYDEEGDFADIIYWE